MDGWWNGTHVETLLTDVRIVGAVNRGGAIVESVPVLQLLEGRCHSCGGPEHEPQEEMSYEMLFAVPAEVEPDAMEAMEARVVILGTRSDGKMVEVRGAGYLGYDDQGAVQGHFDEPPLIVLDRDEDPIAEITVSRSGVRLPAQYVRAGRSRQPIDDSEDPDA